MSLFSVQFCTHHCYADLCPGVHLLSHVVIIGYTFPLNLDEKLCMPLHLWSTTVCQTLKRWRALGRWRRRDSALPSSNPWSAGASVLDAVTWPVRQPRAFQAFCFSSCCPPPPSLLQTLPPPLGPALVRLPLQNGCPLPPDTPNRPSFFPSAGSDVGLFPTGVTRCLSLLGPS